MLSYCHAAMLSCCHTAMLPCCHAGMLSCCPTAMLSYCHVVMLPCCHVVMLSCCHVAMSPCCHVAMLPCCHVVMLLCFQAVMMACCNTAMLSSCHVVICHPTWLSVQVMGVHSIFSLAYSACSSLKMCLLKKQCRFSLAQLMHSCSKLFSCTVSLVYVHVFVHSKQFLSSLCNRQFFQTF